MKKEELEKWIKRNEDTVRENEKLIVMAEEEIEFAKKIIKEIMKIEPSYEN